MAIDLDAPLRFLRTAFKPDDWIAILPKSHDTGGSAQRVGPVSLIANPKFQAWLRAENARRFSVFVSVNAIRPQRKARTRDAIGEIRHVFLDADRDGPSVLAAIEARRDLPPPGCVIHTSPGRLHVLWRVSGFAKEGVEALQKQLARELGTDKAATSCVQVTRLPLEDGLLPLHRVLDVLHADGINGVLVEGGATVLRMFLEQGLLDEAWCLLAPRVFGRGLEVFHGLDLPRSFEIIDQRRHGADCWLRLQPLA